MAFKCSDCGGDMIRVLEEKGNVLYECTDCDNWMTEHVKDMFDESEGVNVP